MQLLFDSSFLKDLERIKDKKIKKKILLFIELVKKSESLTAIPNIRKLSGYKNFYRYKISPYRIGFQKKGSTIILIIIKHRKDIYKRFP